MNLKAGLFVLLLVLPKLFVPGQTVTPEQNEDLYSFSFNNLYFEVDAEHGAKVSSFKIGDSELLTQPVNSTDYLWGATLWPAPQSEMQWPPPMLLDDGEYTAEVNGNVIRFASQVDQDLLNNDLQFVKTFWADEQDKSVTLNYKLVNKSSGQITKALWELARVPVNGIAFWPTGPEGAWGALSDSVVKSADHSWIDIDDESRRNLKFFADGSGGWFAHVNTDNQLLIKSFEDVDQNDFANGEGEIELWIADSYIELENQGATKTLSNNDTVTYEVKWFLRELPAGVTAGVGSSSLLDYVYSVLNGEEPSSLPHPNTIAQEPLVLVYPNPADDYLSFKVTAINRILEVSLYTMDGKLQVSKVLSTEGRLNISSLEPGVYFYTAKWEGGITNGKISVQ